MQTVGGLCGPLRLGAKLIINIECDVELSVRRSLFA